ncbi:MAG TPA: DUF2127 domain-containing protein [Candidatus Binatia bacterium]|nr:DUF2127 domain-containing protein [Candidatus Binatia bacterium]
MVPPAKRKIDFHRAQKSLLRAVASFEFTKGVLALLLGVAAIVLVHQDPWVVAESLLALLHISTDHNSAQRFLDFADSLTDSSLLWAARLAFVYAGMRFAEGYGLWKQRTWAEWLAFASGALLVPFEIRELLRGITFLRSAVFALNLGIVLYMFFLIMDGRKRRRELRQAEQGEADINPSGSTAQRAR